MRAAVLVAAVSLAVSCGSMQGEDGAGEPAPDNLTGLITEVRLEEDQVVSFMIEARAGTFDLLIDPDFDYGFNLKHLEKHRDQRLPVHVEVSARAGQLYAHQILDA